MGSGGRVEGGFASCTLRIYFRDRIELDICGVLDCQLIKPREDLQARRCGSEVSATLVQ